jgi:hypothetical protein
VPTAVPDVCCISGVKPGVETPKPQAAAASGQKAMSKAEIRRERRKLEREHQNRLRELENEAKKVDRQFASRRKALDKKKASSGGSPKDLEPLQQQLTELTTQKETQSKELEELQTAIAKQREEMKQREQELKKREQEIKQKNREFQTFARSVDGKIAKAKSQMEKVQAAASSKTSALVKEEQKVAEEEKAAKAALEQQKKEAEAAYAKMMADLDKAAAAPAPTPTPAPKPTPAKVDGGVELDTDRPGGDYRIIVLDEASPRVCRSACQGEGQCKAWTYVKPQVLGNQARCFLKNNVPNKEKSACCVSGVKQ